MKKFLRKLSYKVGKKRFRMIFSVIFCLPIVIWCCYSDGWRGLIASLLGLIVGQLISIRLFKD